MIAQLQGTIASVIGNHVVLDVNGIGFEIALTGACLTSLGSVGQEASIHTYLQVKDDGFALFGFVSTEEKEIFRRIISVSGAGPKTALAILTAMQPIEFLKAIQFKEVKILTKISGVGKKTAERLILELSELAESIGVEAWEDDDPPPPLVQGGLLEDAGQALQALGYTQAEVNQMLQGIGRDVEEYYDLQALLKAALAQNGSKRGR